MPSLLGRRVEIIGLTSPQGQRLNGQIGGVTRQLEAGRWCVQLEVGDKSVHESKLHLRPLSVAEVGGVPVPLSSALPSPHVQKWPAEYVAFVHAQRQEEDHQLLPKDFITRLGGHLGGLLIAAQQHTSEEYAITYVDTEWVGIDNVAGTSGLILLMKFNLSLDRMLKAVIRRVAGIEATARLVRQLSSEGTRQSFDSLDLARALKAARSTGRDADLVFDSSDLAYAVIAADRFSQSAAHRSRQQVLSSLSLLSAVLFEGGISVRERAVEAKTKISSVNIDPMWPTSQYRMDADRLKRLVDRWVNWEAGQERKLLRTLGKVGLPDMAVARVAAYLTSPPAVSGHKGQYEAKSEDKPQNQRLNPDETARNDSVVQEVFHDEPSPRIDEVVAHTAAQYEADENWADSVERRLAESSSNLHAAPAEAGPQQAEQVFLLRAGGDNVEGLRQRLLTGPELAPCREALQSASDSLRGRSCELPEKALVFVRPWQYDTVRQALVGVELKYFHIIVSRGFEYLIDEALSKFPCRQRPKLKQHRETIASVSPEPPAGVEPAVLSDDSPIIAARDFLCIASRSGGIGSRLIPAEQVEAQSTTEAVSESACHYAHYRGVNPRRVMAASSTSSQ